VSEQPSWGPATKRGQQLIVAATRKEAARGAAQISFDLYYYTKGKRRFIAEHPENDSGPAFSPSGEHVAFSSGRSGQGDIYIYSLFAEGEPITRLTFEEGGSELYPTWSSSGSQLAYIGHLGGADHLLLIDKVSSLLGQKDDRARMTAARAATRDLTAGWQHSAFAPSFSPDGKWIAFYMHPKGQLRSDLYVVKTSGGEPTLLMENVVPGTRNGPCWSPDGDGVFIVEESAKRMNPILWIPLDPAKGRQRVDTQTQLNTDLSLWKTDSGTYLLFAAQGGGEKDAEKRWRKIFVTRLVRK
jgi:Tol biopolymer transport system component